MKSNKNLIEDFKKIRNELNKRANQVIRNSPNYKIKTGIVIFSLIVVLMALILLITAVYISAQKQNIINHYYTKEEIKPVTVIEKVIRTENINIIRGDKKLVCLGQPDSRKMVCYKELD